mgnify:CR=1 FL=1
MFDGLTFPIIRSRSDSSSPGGRRACGKKRFSPALKFLLNQPCLSIPDEARVNAWHVSVVRVTADGLKQHHRYSNNPKKKRRGAAGEKGGKAETRLRTRQKDILPRFSVTNRWKIPEKEERVEFPRKRKFDSRRLSSFRATKMPQPRHFSECL